ncbi:TPA: winged helix-turn-helix domain-containing protein [Klebsiella pneumoniae]|nr:winged helix-turn-helix domain-containing protein [Klebsiella pneumoniae]
MLTDEVHFNIFRIIALIMQRFSVSYSIPGMNIWFHRNGYGISQPQSHMS